MKYRYNMQWTIYGSGFTHSTTYNAAREAINAARVAYAALYVTIGRADLDTRGGDSPAVFNEIRRKECTRASAEPRNRSFVISISKRPA